MADVSVKRIDEMETAFRGAFKRARAELGVEAFGISVLDLPPNLEQYPAHDHAADGQEEVYVTLRGEIEVDVERHFLDQETIVRVGPGSSRKVWPGDDGLRLLVVGGVPDKLYEAPEASYLGAPDPLAPSA